MNKSAKWFLLATAAVVAHGQPSDPIRRATLTGSGGTSGKCTIEVRVDMSAEVDVYGDSGRLRTLAGQPATWSRLECTGPLPYNMADFRFRGVDGRGTAKLIQDPRNNSSMAVIRIDDPNSGAEGYTFDIEWSGANGGTPTGGFPAGWGTPATGGRGSASPRSSAEGGWGTNSRGTRMSAESAIDLCRAEVRARGERDYGVRNIDITSAAVDTGQGRRNWVTGEFRSRGGAAASRGGGYRFNCEVDYLSGQVRNVEFQRTDGSGIQPTNQSGTSSQTAIYGSSGSDQTRALRACQDAVVARTNRDGYQNVVFNSTAVDTNRTEWISGAITAIRGPVTDTFTFGCSMDMRAASVRNLEFNRR